LTKPCYNLFDICNKYAYIHKYVKIHVQYVYISKLLDFERKSHNRLRLRFIRILLEKKSVVYMFYV